MRALEADGSGACAPISAAAMTPQPLPGFEGLYELDKRFKCSTSSIEPSISAVLQSCPTSGPYRFNGLERWQIDQVLQYEEDHGAGVGASLNIFPSGEITAGCYSLGVRNYPSSRKARVNSPEMTKRARKTVRRAMECNPDVSFSVFVTLTFDPKLSKLDESGLVDQRWAKLKLHKFLDALTRNYSRRGWNFSRALWLAVHP